MRKLNFGLDWLFKVKKYILTFQLYDREKLKRNIIHLEKLIMVKFENYFRYITMDEQLRFGSWYILGAKIVV